MGAPHGGRSQDPGDRTASQIATSRRGQHANPILDRPGPAPRSLIGGDLPTPPVRDRSSSGGRVAIEFGLEYPDKVNALVLVGSSLGGYAFSDALDAFETENENAYDRGAYDSAAEVDLRVWVAGPRRTPEQVDPVFRARADELARDVYLVASDSGSSNRMEPPAIERLRELRVPTLIVAGDLAQPDMLRTADRLLYEVRGAHRVIMPGTAHLPSMEQPERFNAMLREIGQDNWDAVVNLELEEGQRTYLEPNAVSLAEPRFHPWMLPLSIYNGEEVVGFAMFAQWPDPHEGNDCVHRFMVDRRQQRKGYGTTAMRELLRRFATDYPACQTLWIGYDANNHAAQQFYARLGFVETGEAPWGGDLAANIEVGAV